MWLRDLFHLFLVPLLHPLITTTILPPSLPPSLPQALAYFHPSALLSRLAASPGLEVELLEKREKKEGGEKEGEREGRRAGRRKGVCLRYDPRERVYHVLCEEGGREGGMEGKGREKEETWNGGEGEGGGGREGGREGGKVVQLLRAEELVAPKARTHPLLESLLTPVFSVWRKRQGRKGEGGVMAMGVAVGAVALDRGGREGGREGGRVIGAAAAASSLWELPTLLGIARDGGR